MTLLQYIEERLQQQRTQRKVPINVPLAELKQQHFEDLSQQLRTLHRQGKIKYYEGVNDIHIYQHKSDILPPSTKTNNTK